METIGIAAAQVVLRWLRQEGIAAISKSVHAERIRQNLVLDDFGLGEGDMAAVRAMDRGKCLILDVPALDEAHRLHSITFRQ